MNSSLFFLLYTDRERVSEREQGRSRDLDDVEALFIYLYRIKKELQGVLTFNQTAGSTSWRFSSTLSG